MAHLHPSVRQITHLRRVATGVIYLSSQAMLHVLTIDSRRSAHSRRHCDKDQVFLFPSFSHMLFEDHAQGANRNI